MLTRVTLPTMLILLQSFSAQAFQDPGSPQPGQQQPNGTRQMDAPRNPTITTVQTAALPPGEDAWSVQIVSRGGFTGAGRGNLTAISDGSLAWVNAEDSCTGKLERDSIADLTKVVAAASAYSNSVNSTLVGLCG